MALPALCRYNYTAVQCKGRWNTLWQNYKTTRDHNNTTGNDARTCKFYDEIEIVVGRQPNVNPVAACSSHHPLQTNAVSDSSDNEDLPVLIPTHTLKRKAASKFIQQSNSNQKENNDHDSKTKKSNNSQRVDEVLKAKRVRKVAKKTEVMEYLKERDENIVEIERNKLKLLENSQKESQEHSKKIENILTSLIDVLKNVAQ